MVHPSTQATLSGAAAHKGTVLPEVSRNTYLDPSKYVDACRRP